MLHFEHLQEHETTWTLSKFAPRRTEQCRGRGCGWMQRVWRFPPAALLLSPLAAPRQTQRAAQITPTQNQPAPCTSQVSHILDLCCWLKAGRK